MVKPPAKLFKKNTTRDWQSMFSVYPGAAVLLRCCVSKLKYNIGQVKIQS